MSPFYQILLVAVHATSVALIASPQALPLFALAKPISRSLSSRTIAVHHIKERSIRVDKSRTKAKAAVPQNSHPSPANVSYSPHSYSSPGSRVPAGAYRRSGDTNVNTVVQNIDILNDYYTKASHDAQTFKTYSSQASASRQKGTYKFQQNCASTLTDFHTNSQGYAGTLRRMGAYKGRAHYDKNDPLETYVKDLVDLCKDMLSYVNKLIDCDRTLGPILGPIVYDIKCILDEILDATENLIDAASLEQLIEGYGLAACKSGDGVTGVCL